MLGERLILSVAVLLLSCHLSTQCGISTHLEVGERAAEYLGIISEGVDYKQLVRAHPDAFQGGASYPDAFYASICYGGQYADVSEDTHWTPFLNASVNYIRRTYPKPWNETVEKLVVFLLAVVQHQVADVNFHSLGIEEGFLRTMGHINCHGSFGEAHSLGDFGGDVLNVAGLNMDYIAIVQQWYIPADDLLNIYTDLYGQEDRISEEVIRNCSALLFMGRLGENIGAIEVTYPYYSSNSPFLHDRLQDFFLGGVDDMAVWTHNVWEDTVTMLDHGTEVCSLPQEPIYIECNPPPLSAVWQIHAKLSSDAQLRQDRISWKREHLDNMMADLLPGASAFSVKHVHNGLLFTANGPVPDNHVEESVLALEDQQDSDFSYYTNIAYSRLGEAVVTGDVNNDGFVDLLVGAPGYGADANHQQGRVYIVYGGADGFPRQNASIETIADVILEGPRPNGRFGSSIALLDFNVDGITDVAIGAPHVGSENLQYNGAVYVYFNRGSGPSTTPNNVLQCIYRYSNCGSSLTSADVNGDMSPDLLIGIPTAPNAGEQTGSLMILLADIMRQDGAIYDELWTDWTFNGPQNYDWFGFAHTTVQTSTGETLLVISAPAHRVCSQPDCSYDDEDTQAAGQVFIFRVPLRPVPDAILTGTEEFQQFGYTLSPGRFGNTNVLAITSLTRSGTGANTTHIGEVSLYDVNTLLTPGVQPIHQFYGDTQFARFGSAVTFLDANGDGSGDMLVSSPFWSLNYRSEAEGGRVQLIDGAQPSSNWTTIVGEGKSRFGRDVALANQNSVIIGAPHTNIRDFLALRRLAGAVHFYDNIVVPTSD